MNQQIKKKSLNQKTINLKLQYDDKLRIGFQNILSVKLGTNPQEFRLNNAYVNPKIFEQSDLLFNPKTNKYSLEIPTIKDIVFNIIDETTFDTLLNHDKFLKQNEEVWGLTLNRLFEKQTIMNMKLQEIIECFDKSVQNQTLDEFALSSLDKQASKLHFKRFYEINGNENDLINEIEQNMNKIVFESHPEFFFYFVIDLAKRLMLKVIYTNDIKTDHEFIKLFKSETEKIKNINYQAYSGESFIKIKSIQDDQNKLTISQKMDKILNKFRSEPVTETKKIAAIGLCEVDEESYNNLRNQKGDDQNIMPENYPGGLYITVAITLNSDQFKLIEYKQLDKDNRIIMLHTQHKGRDLIVCQCHLASGSASEQRKQSIEQIMNYFKPYQKAGIECILAGDFNEDLKLDGNALVDMMLKNGMQQPHSFVYTVTKERSSMQYQINKINYLDISAKDAILSSKQSLDYKSINTEWSDHHMVQQIRQ